MRIREARMRLPHLLPVQKRGERLLPGEGREEIHLSRLHWGTVVHDEGFSVQGPLVRAGAAGTGGVEKTQ